MIDAEFALNHPDCEYVSLVGKAVQPGNHGIAEEPQNPSVVPLPKNIQKSEQYHW